MLRWARTPDERETYFSPVIYTKKDSAELVIFGTGGETHPGGLWIVTLMDLYQGLIENSKCIYKDDHKGMIKGYFIKLDRIGFIHYLRKISDGFNFGQKRSQK